MKVLHVHTAYKEAGGEDVVVETEREMLREIGLDVIPVDAHNPEGHLAATAALASATWNGHAAARVLALARRNSVDLVHIHNTWFALSASVPARLSAAGYPVVATLHNYRLMCANGLLFRDGHHCEDCLDGRVWPAITHACYRGSRPQSMLAAVPIAVHRRLGLWTKSVDRFITLTPAARDIFVRAGLPEAQLSLRPNVVADPGPRLRSPSESDTVLFVGRLSGEKGLHTLLDAWNRALLPDLELVVVGDGPERHLRAMASERVRFLGRLDAPAVRRKMLGARALMFPSLYAETFGLVPVEAMAAGLPVLVSDVGDVPRMTGVKGTDQAVAPGNVKAWAAAMNKLSSADLVDELGARNRQHYEATFTPTGAAVALRTLYEDVVAEHAHR